MHKPGKGSRNTYSCNCTFRLLFHSTYLHTKNKPLHINIRTYMLTQMHTNLQLRSIFMIVLKHAVLGKEYYLECICLVAFTLHLRGTTCFDILWWSHDSVPQGGFRLNKRKKGSYFW